ncbi:MAG: magnesium transporter CorA family protein [Elusimicrobia bacterium]|nr:magnesium transporter CorA family protein [Elusimicrobiota bacterium]
MSAFEIVDGKLAEGKPESAPVWVFSNPDDAEKARLVADFGLDAHTLSSALDPDEPSRLEFESEHLALIFKRPKNYSAKDQFVFKVASTGMFLFKDKLIVVISEDVPLFSGKHFHGLQGVQEVFLKLIYVSIWHYLEHLKVINMISEEIEKKINVSMENKYLLNLFSLEKSLVYYLSAVNSNGYVIEKLRNHSAKVGLCSKCQEFLDDIIVENQQCYRQAEIYSNILASLMDARASIVGNNLNILMKKLNAIVVAVMVPTFFASIGGMSEWTMMTGGAHWKLSYTLFLLAMVALGIGTYIAIEKYERH